MQSPQEVRPRSRSAFAAAFLSLIFPGLGHLYAGVPARALGFAALPILVLSLFAAVFVPSGTAQCDDSDASSAQGSSGNQSPTVTPTNSAGTANPSVSAQPLQTAPPWNGKDRLNILLVGADQRPGEGTFNTDTLIVVS